MSNLTLFFCSPNKQLEIEHSMCGRQAPWSPLWWLPCESCLCPCHWTLKHYSQFTLWNIPDVYGAIYGRLFTRIFISCVVEYLILFVKGVLRSDATAESYGEHFKVQNLMTSTKSENYETTTDVNNSTVNAHREADNVNEISMYFYACCYLKRVRSFVTLCRSVIF